MLDIEYLLLLQKLRENIGEHAGKIASVVSDLPLGVFAILIITLFYWCIDKRTGLLALLSQALGGIVVNFIKLCACVYRPWIRDARVHPAESAFESATGYSFPSGHSQTVTSEFGALGFSTWKKNKVVSVLCWLFIPLIMFTRNFLGVHTPQDVLVGFAIGLATVLFINWLLKWESKGKNRDIIVFAVSVVITVAVLVIISVKPYPMDYVDGKLLVDPAGMKKDCFTAAGIFICTVGAWLVEKRWVKFTTEVSVQAKVFREVCGMILIGAIVVLFSALKSHMNLYVYYFVKYGLLFFTATALWPAIFCAVEKAVAGRRSKKQ